MNVNIHPGIVERADLLKPIQGASDDGNVLFHDVSIDLGRLHIGMTHQFLNDPNVNPVFKQVGSKTMAIMPSSA
jgi:hypothetical protein